MTQDEIAGYLIAVQNWYALPTDADFRSASITSLDMNATIGGEGAQLYKQTYHLLEVPSHEDLVNIGACRPIGELYYETLEAAQSALKELSIANPQFGYNSKE